MKNTRMAQQLRALSMKPSMESEGENAEGSTTETGPAGDGVVKTDIEPAQDVQADGAGAPAEDQDLAAKTVTVDEGPKEETAETTSADDGENVVVSQEGDGEAGQGSDTTTGDGEQTTKVNIEPAQDTQADGAGAPGEDQQVEAKVVDVGERSDLETAETEVDGGETVSQEGLGGAMKAFGKTWGIGLRSLFKSQVGRSKAYASFDVEQKREADRLKKKIDILAKRLVEFREGDRKKAIAEGIKIPESQVAPLDENELIVAVLKGMYIPFYTTYYGHKVESLEEELNAKLAEMSKLLNNVSTESIEEDLGPLLVSTEGFKGAFKAFGKVWGIALSNIFSDDGVFNDQAKFSKLDVDQKRRAEELKQKIEIIAKRVADYRDGDRAAAKKAGLSVPASELKELSEEQTIDAIVKGTLIPFYTTYYGHKVESLEKDLNKLMAELAGLVGSKVSTESDTTDGAANAAVAAAAAVAEGAAAAAEAAAAAVDAATDTPAEVVAAAEVSTGETTDETAVEGADVGAGEMEELEEAIEAGEEHAEKYENEVTTLESLIETLEDARRTGGLTPQSARIFQISFESMGVRLTGAPFKNQHGENAMPSLESFGGTARRIDATQASLESAQGVLAKIIEVMKATWKQIMEWLVKFYEAAFNQAARLKQRADKIVEVAKKANGQPKASQIKLGNLAQKIAIGSNVTADNIGVLEALVQEAASRGEVASQGIQKIREKLTEVGQSGSFTALVEAFNVAENSGDLRSAAFKTALQHDGKDGFATDVLPGNYKLFTYHPSKEGAGTVGRALAAYQLTYGYPVTRIDGDGGPAEDAATATLTPAQIINLAQRAKKIIEAFENTKKDIKAEALDLGNVQFSDKLEGDQVKGLQSIINDITRAVRSSSNSQAKLAKVVITSAGDFLDVAAASLKQYSSAEAAAAAEPAAA